MDTTEPAARPAAVFIDRDGVINELIRGGYVLRWEEFCFRPGVLSALCELAKAAIPAFIITNQSCVGRGLLTPDGLAAIHDQLCLAVSGAGGVIAGIEVCPHHPDDGCQCRKPRPGLFLQAARTMGSELSRTVVVGDSEADLAAAAAAGCRRFYWVDAPDEAQYAALRRVLPAIDILRVGSLAEAVDDIVRLPEAANRRKGTPD